MVKTEPAQWISTGRAAAMLGYSRWTFLRKFQGRLACRVLASGHRRWLQSEVKKLADGDG